jgi:pimeloyl-ACP methyl ester carboxylesterase
MQIPVKPALIAGLWLTLNACGGSSGEDNPVPDDGSPGVQASIEWQDCGGDSALQCATLTVPKNHRDPDGSTIDIALNRIPASGADPLGSLLFNPGGPGGSGTELVEMLGAYDLLPSEITSRYHIVGFDPRGVNKSTPIDCREFDLDDVDDYPLDVEALQQTADNLQSFVDSCMEKYGDYLLHLGSEAVADDMEAIRRGLDESTLNFVAYSYGTRLAGIYLQKYPSTTGRFILDGSLPPTHDSIFLFRGQLQALEANFQSLVTACTGFSDCDPDNYQLALENRVASLIESESDFELGLLASVLIAGVEQPGLSEQIAEPLYEYVQQFDTAPLVQLALALELDDDTDSDYDSDTVGRAVICADDPARPSVAELESLRRPFNEVSDLFAEIQLAGAATCLNWPDALYPLAETATMQAPESLVIGGPTDAQTPVEWSEAMAAAIGGRYLRSEHPGHTTVFSGANACTDRAAIDFLLNGVLPDISVCPLGDQSAR